MRCKICDRPLSEIEWEECDGYCSDHYEEIRWMSLFDDQPLKRRRDYASI